MTSYNDSAAFPFGRGDRKSPRYDWRDYPENEGGTAECSEPTCSHRARWAIARPEDWPDSTAGLSHPDVFNWVFRAFACGQHMHGVLHDLDWILDCVQVYDLAAVPEGGC